MVLVSLSAPAFLQALFKLCQIANLAEKASGGGYGLLTHAVSARDVTYRVPCVRFDAR